MTVTNKNVRAARRDGEEGEQCLAVNEVIALIHDKWTLLVLGALSHHPALRYNELQREVGGISQRMLTLTLKELEANGLVLRTVHATVPPRVDYELTDMGRSLGVPLRALLQWSAQHRAPMAAAREAYAARKSHESTRARSSRAQVST